MIKTPGTWVEPPSPRPLRSDVPVKTAELVPGTTITIVPGMHGPLCNEIQQYTW